MIAGETFKIKINFSGNSTAHAFIFNAHAVKILTFQAEVLELVAFGVGDVSGLLAVVLRGQLQLLLPVTGAAAGGLGTGRTKTRRYRYRSQSAKISISSYQFQQD